MNCYCALVIILQTFVTLAVREHWSKCHGADSRLNRIAEGLSMPLRQDLQHVQPHTGANPQSTVVELYSNRPHHIAEVLGARSLSTVILGTDGGRPPFISNCISNADMREGANKDTHCPTPIPSYLQLLPIFWECSKTIRNLPLGYNLHYFSQITNQSTIQRICLHIVFPAACSTPSPTVC